MTHGTGRIERVRKRDGREVPFDPRKIQSSIYRAARSVGGEDHRLADELADVVVHFLEKHAESDVQSIEDIQDMVEKVLIETGHARMAKAFILYRDRRSRLRDELRVRRVRPLLDVDELPATPWVSNGRDDPVEAWSKARIAEDLERSAGLPASAAHEVASAVEDRVLRSGLERVSTSLIRELVEHELRDRELAGPLVRWQKVGVPLTDFERLLRGTSAGGGAPTPDGVREGLIDSLFRSYWVSHVFSSDVVEAHAEGRIRIAPFGDPFRALAVEPRSAGDSNWAPCTVRTWRGVAADCPPGRDTWRIVRIGDIADLAPVESGDRLDLRLLGDEFSDETRAALALALGRASTVRVRVGSAAHASGTVLGACALNLPRAALRGAAEAPPRGATERTRLTSREGLFLEVDAAIELAVRALAQRRRFLATVTAATRPGAFADLVRASEDVVEPFGVRESVEFVSGEPLRPGSAADGLAAELLLHVDSRLRAVAAREGTPARLGAELDPAIGVTFASLDARYFPWETGLMGSALRPQGGAYGPGLVAGELLAVDPPSRAAGRRSATIETGLLPLELRPVSERRCAPVELDHLVDRLARAARSASLLRPEPARTSIRTGEG
ncbi:MAG: hypothetical protein HYR85_11270 [Planctomycetes bacterium]|nr:hypothetical protein [Planctomycetota bacterium]MBI3846469.1 hypothetical protein [Planctomycetota bacterium]